MFTYTYIYIYIHTYIHTYQPRPYAISTTLVWVFILPNPRLHHPRLTTMVPRAIPHTNTAPHSPMYP